MVARKQPRSRFEEVEPLRQASRQMVRELGFLDHRLSVCGVTHSECHALIELDHFGRLSAGELSTRLNLDKSSASRVLSRLVSDGLVRAEPDPEDGRRKRLTLTKKGRGRVGEIHAFANAQVEAALTTLSPEARRTVVEGVQLYAGALAKVRARSSLTIEPIQPKDDPDVARIIRLVMPEFGACGPGFALHDPEVGGMSAAYARPGAAYFVVRRGAAVVGGAGYAPLEGGPDDTCELRKMYFDPEVRGIGMGRRLLEHVLAAATEAGYRRCYLETLARMTSAERLYTAAGFERLDRPLGATGHFGCDRWYARPLGPPRSKKRGPA